MTALPLTSHTHPPTGKAGGCSHGRPATHGDAGGGPAAVPHSNTWDTGHRHGDLLNVQGRWSGAEKAPGQWEYFEQLYVFGGNGTHVRRWLKQLAPGTYSILVCVGLTLTSKAGVSIAPSALPNTLSWSGLLERGWVWESEDTRLHRCQILWPCSNVTLFRNCRACFSMTEQHCDECWPKAVQECIQPF